MRIIIVFLLLCSIPSIGQVEWLNKGGGQGSEYVKDISTDTYGNLYTVGTFDGTILLQGSTFNAVGSTDMFLMKTASTGSPEWTKSFGYQGSVEPVGIIIVGNFIYVAGHYNGSVSFDSISLQSVSVKDLFITKFDYDGNVQWAESMGGYGTDICTAFDIDNEGNIYFAGLCFSSIDIDPTIGVDETGSGGMFLVKYNTNFTPQWTKMFSGSVITTIIDIGFDQSNNVLLVGRLSNTIDFDPGIGEEIVSPIGDSDAFLFKLTSLGSFVWSKTLTGAYTNSTNATTNWAGAVACDSDNNVIWGGLYKGELQLPNGDVEPDYGYLDAFIQKVDENGDLIWTESFGNSGLDNLSDIKVDNNDNIYFSGSFGGTFDFDFGPNEYLHSSLGGENSVIVLLTKDAERIESFNFSGVCSSNTALLDICLNGEVYFAGNFSGSLVVDAPPVVATYYSSQYYDIYYGKMNATVSVEEHLSSGELSSMIYPNPTSNQFTVDLGKVHANVEMKITDVLGKTIFEQSYSSIQLLDYFIPGNAGLYFVRIEADSRSRTLTLVKE